MMLPIINSFIDHIFRRVYFSALFEDKYGVKYYNQLMKSTKYNVLDSLIVDYRELYLGFDGLNDKYTLVDVCIDQSPHYSLMKALDKGLPIIETDYYIRLKRGYLDSRRAIRINNKYTEMMNGKFDVRKKQVLEDKYDHVQIYILNGKKYIADGKHRAALCAYLDVPVQCDVISKDFLSDSYRQWMLMKMKDKREYSKHNVFMFLSDTDKKDNYFN